MGVSKTQNTISEWFTWLSQYEWKYIGTLTVREDCTKENLRKAFESWIRRLENLNQKRVNYYFNLEQTDLGRPHVHFVLGNISAELSASRMRGVWSRGHSEIKHYDPTRGGLFYVLKEISQSENSGVRIKGLRRRGKEQGRDGKPFPVNGAEDGAGVPQKGYTRTREVFQTGGRSS